MSGDLRHGASQRRPGARDYLLTLNGGSSSLRFALFTPGSPPVRAVAGKVDRIGPASSTLEVPPFLGRPAETLPVAATDHVAAAGAVLDWLASAVGLDAVAAAGHRVVHGGTRYAEPQIVSPEVLAELRRLSPLDPAHLPGEIAVIETLARLRPGLLQVACFDTAFHARMPRVAQLLGIPRRYADAGVRRYGFHGLSYSFLMAELERVAGVAAARGKVILAHLGNGASLAAVSGGRCLDTTMGFTPASGILMGTRSGDLDPGVLVYLMRQEGLGADQVDELVNKRSGLLGVSDVGSDMRDLLACRDRNEGAAEAIALFCHQARKAIGALAAVLGGLDTLVFAGGIGESAAPVRAEICANLDFLGVHLDEARNAAGHDVISADRSPATIRVIRTDEELVIARAVAQMLERRTEGKGG